MGEVRIHRAVSDDGTEIVGRVHGQGPALVLLHGRLEDGDSCWKALLPLLTDRFTCLAPSTRGRGLSGDSPDHSPVRLMEDAAAFVDSIGEPVGVVGWSSGGGLALAALARSPAASAGAVYEPSVSEVIHGQEATRLKGAVEGMVRLVEEGRPVDAARGFIAVVASDDELAAATASGFDAVWARYVPVALQEFQQTHLAASEEPGPTDPSMLGRVRVPTLVLHGERTSLRWVADGVQHLAEHVPDVEVRRLAGVGHLAPIVQPDGIATELIRFFEAAP
ncbi:MAG: alpha/beta hydrolase [Nitriliruptor sp.]|nr:MAG: alpha/beta hydrolase [Nitriliruptor sp.]